MRKTIAELKTKRENEKKFAEQPKTFKEKRGLITRLSEEMKLNTTREERRMQARVFIKDPTKYSKNVWRHITKRGKFFAMLNG